MRLTVLVALLLVVGGCYLMLDSARDMADDVAMSSGQLAQLMIPATRPQRAFVHWRARNGVQSQTEILVINP